MELKIYSPQDAGFIQRIDWNFEELKAEITAAAQEYETSVYTDDTIKAAKADRAKLNKFVDALEGKRTEIRKKLLEPDELFGQQVKELTGIVQRAIKNIDGQVKDYEERQRKEKLDKVREFYEENIQDLAEYLPWERVMKPEYGNASKTMKSILPLKEQYVKLLRAENLLIHKVNRAFFNDVNDHLQFVLQTIEICRETLSSLVDLYISNNDLRMNDIMKRLTIVSTIFIPLTFLVGVWGMNYKWMPELDWRYGYLFAWILMGVIGIVVYLYFRKKKWY